MACSTVTTTAGEILYSFDLYETDFSSLWTLIPDVPGLNFPLITFSNTVDGSIPVNDANTGDTLEDVFYPSYPNNMQLISPDLSAYNAKILGTTPQTISYLLSTLSDVFASTKDISSDITYGIEIVVSASQDKASELSKAWDEAWERGLINPTSSVMYSYFFLMGLSYKIDIRRSEGTQLPDFENWLNQQSVPADIQGNLLSLDSQLFTNGPSPWQTEYNYTNDGFTPYDITSVFFGIEELTVNPNWVCNNPYAFIPDIPAVSGQSAPLSVFGVSVSGGLIPFSNPSVSWTKYQSFKRPRLDAIRAYGRLIIPDSVEKIESGVFSTTAAAISGSRIISIDIPYGVTLSSLIPAPYGAAMIPSPVTPGVSANWFIDTLITSSSWQFDNVHSGAASAYNDHFTLNIKVPIELINDLKVNPLLGSEVINIKWTGKFIGKTSFIFNYLNALYFAALYSSCDAGDTNKVKYVPGVGILFDVQSYSNGTNTVQSNLSACKTDILSIYDNYCNYAKNYSVFSNYGDILNLHGRYFDTHGAEFFATSKQVMRPQQYLPPSDSDIEISLDNIIDVQNAVICTNGNLYNADDLSKTTCNQPTNIFESNQIPLQNSSTSVSLSNRISKLNGKLCPIIPPILTPKK